MNTTSTPPSIPEALNRHLSANSTSDARSLALYVDRGAALVSPAALAALRSLRESLQAKIDALGAAEVLRRRLNLLATYFDETFPGSPLDEPVRRDIAFALLYFLKGFDRIPDSVPDVGLLDDAMIVDSVLQRHSTTLQAHWRRHARAWPEKR